MFMGPLRTNIKGETICSYPMCCQHPKASFDVAVENVRPLPGIEETTGKARIPFCLYHFYIVAGDDFTVKIDDSKADLEFELHGPFKEVKIAELVAGAIQTAKDAKT
jgi:hypothetical protein